MRRTLPLVAMTFLVWLLMWGQPWVMLSFAACLVWSTETRALDHVDSHKHWFPMALACSVFLGVARLAYLLATPV